MQTLKILLHPVGIGLLVLGVIFFSQTDKTRSGGSCDAQKIRTDCAARQVSFCESKPNFDRCMSWRKENFCNIHCAKKKI